MIYSTWIIHTTIKYLNEVTESNYDPIQYSNGKNNFIFNLIKEGYTYKDFKKVIDKKWKDWEGTKYQQYVRPQTLFGEKFKSYLNESTTTRKNSLQKLSDSVTKAQRANWRLDKK
jgi:uncharacterized phage protein (TIGR02220 family)